ncbi:MAG TPA: hypothetical protein VLM05_09715 [Mycobacteriales bacterium]|nr:hypothetical protein [Mycobacteriales bacterium]
MIVGALAGLLVTAAVIGAVGSFRAHAAYRESLRELRDGDRRLEPGPGGRRLEDELRWYADVCAATRDSGWRSSAAVVLALCAAAFVPGIWALSGAPALTVATVVVLLVAAVLVAALTVLDGRRSEGQLRSAARRSALGNVRRLEDSLAAVHRATLASRAAHRAWLQARAADHPLASVLASLRRRTYARSVVRRNRALAALARAVPVSLAGVSVRAPDGYAEGLRGLAPLAGGGPLDDDTWAAAVADLSRAAERDVPRRTRWLSALAACAELRSDPPARESAARWALDAAALPPRALGDSRTDPLPDAVAFEPVRPATWEGALRRARLNHAGPILLAEVTLRWAYALVADPASAAPAAEAGAGSTAHGATVATEVIPVARDATERIPTDPSADRPTLAGATAAATDRPPARPVRGVEVGPASGPDTAVDPANVLDPAVAAAAEIMTETADPDEYLRRVRPGFESLGATSAQLSRLVPTWHAPAPAPTP